MEQKTLAQLQSDNEDAFNLQLEDPIRNNLYGLFVERKLIPVNKRLSLTPELSAAKESNPIIEKVITEGFRQALTTGTPRDVKITAVVEGSRFEWQQSSMQGDALSFTRGKVVLGPEYSNSKTVTVEFRVLLIDVSGQSIIVAVLPEEN